MFKLLPILDTMLALYEMPAGSARFEKYLSLLQGGKKGDLALPIGNYNPMAKPFILNYIKQLQALNIENEIEFFIQSKQVNTPQEVAVVLNIADDLKGGWTNRFTTDYSSRFGTSALLKRNFCTPIVWTSEEPELASILKVTERAIRRFLFQWERGIPKTLQEQVDQELFAYGKSPSELSLPTEIQVFLDQEAKTESYHIIFPFFYGEEATAPLEMTTLGIGQGFLYYLNQ